MSSRINDRGKIFRDPIHHLIRIEPGDEVILNLIDTGVFQRLRRIRQLGVSWLTYHGAEHSRFAHSLGVFNFAQRILQSLLNRYKGNSELVGYLNSHSKELKAAALLHDIGHGPFSHMLERVFDGSSNHENKTVELIRDEASEIGQCLADANVEADKVADIIEQTSQDRLIVDIVSSQLDADRMDYLLRDSLHTGVEYGVFDAEWLVQNLCIGKDPISNLSTEGTNGFLRHRLCLDRDRGLHSAEQFILARQHMTMQVYMHRVTRGYEVLLLNMFQAATQLSEKNSLPTETPEVVRIFFSNKGALNSTQWERFDETAMFAAIAIWADASDSKYATLRRMAQAFLSRKHIYKSRKVDLAILGLSGSADLQSDLKKNISERGVEWAIDEGAFKPYKGLLYAASQTRDEPEELSAESILLASGSVDEFAVPVDTDSLIFRTLDYKILIANRIYYDRERATEIESILDKHGVSAA